MDNWKPAVKKRRISVTVKMEEVVSQLFDMYKCLLAVQSQIKALFGCIPIACLLAQLINRVLMGPIESLYTVVDFLLRAARKSGVPHL